jgi:alanine racemase
MTTPTTPGLLTISLKALKENYALLKSRTSAEVSGVIKANGYGLGALPVFTALYEEGCRTFFVATPEEGEKLRKHNPGLPFTVYILGGVYKGAEDFYLHHNLTPVLNSPEELERWSRFGKQQNKKLSTAIHIDTGMNRLGFEETPNAENLSSIDLKLVLSHFSSSDEKVSPANERQAAAFAKIAARFPGTPKSLCNSSAIFRNKDWHYDLLRPGIALYGGNPVPEAANPMKPVVSLDVRVLQIRTAKKGESAGYNETYVFEKDTRCAIVACGYADGFLRSGSNRANLFWNGHPCPVRGRVSMDLLIADISGLQNPPQEGDFMEILGASQSIDDLANACGTISYEILTSLGKRYVRKYY